MKNKRSTHRIAKKTKILTFNPWFLTKLMESNSWARAIIIHELLKYTHCKLNHEQFVILNGLSTEPYKHERIYEQKVALKWTSDGFRILDADLETSLYILDFMAHRILD